MLKNLRNGILAKNPQGSLLVTRALRQFKSTSVYIDKKILHDFIFQTKSLEKFSMHCVNSKSILKSKNRQKSQVKNCNLQNFSRNPIALHTCNTKIS
jgi:hypothetical protein